jgi:hypothetical protein
MRKDVHKEHAGNPPRHFIGIQDQDRMKNAKKWKQVVVKVDMASAEAAKPVPVRVKSPQSPRVVLELINSAAQKLFVAGSFNSWRREQTPLVAARRWAMGGKSESGSGSVARTIEP